MTDPKEDLTAWYREHYDLDDHVVVEGEDGEKTALARCRRCGTPTGWITKHAVERHGDPIEVIQPAPGTSPVVLAAY